MTWTIGEIVDGLSRANGATQKFQWYYVRFQTKSGYCRLLLNAAQDSLDALSGAILPPHSLKFMRSLSMYNMPFHHSNPSSLLDGGGMAFQMTPISL
jgi:hypothetical protein